MTKSGLLETRSNLSQIIRRVVLGEEHIILKNDVPVAKIVPIEETAARRLRDLVQDIKYFRQRVKKVTMDEINSWKRQGRP